MSSRRRSRRGTTLIEGMVAAGIFAIGLVGTIQMIFIASRQNTTAGRMTHAGAIATDVRTALQNRGFTFLTGGSGPLRAGLCTTDPAVRALAGRLATIPGACVIDFDAYENSATQKLIASYDEDAAYRRLLVHVPDTNVPGQVDTVNVVVQFSDLGRNVLSHQVLALYRVTANQARVEL